MPYVVGSPVRPPRVIYAREVVPPPPLLPSDVMLDTLRHRVTTLSAEATAILRIDQAALDELLRLAHARGVRRAAAWAERTLGLRVRSNLQIPSEIRAWERDLLGPLLTDALQEILMEPANEET